jgi:hypothetical protein
VCDGHDGPQRFFVEGEKLGYGIVTVLGEGIKGTLGETQFGYRVSGEKPVMAGGMSSWMLGTTSIRYSQNASPQTKKPTKM